MNPRILYLDGAHQTETPFLQRLTKVFRSQPAVPFVIVHGGGVFAEQALEGRGLFPERAGGVLQVESAEEYALVDRATRQFNKKLVALLTEEGVPAVGVTGTSRNLLRLTDDGRIAAGRTEWLAELTEDGAVPVVAALAYDGTAERIREVNAAMVIAVLAGRLHAEVVCFTGDDAPGVRGADGETMPVISLDALPEEGVLPEPEAVRTIAESGAVVIVTNTNGIAQASGTRVEGR